MELETGIMITLWDQILQHFQMTSASLQSSGQDLNTACALYESLQGYIQALRSTFSDIKQKGKTLSGCEEYKCQIRRELVLVVLIQLLNPKLPLNNLKLKTFFFLQSLTSEEVSRKSSNIIKSYPADLEESLGEELLHFIELLKAELLISNDSKSKQELVKVQLYCLITENSLYCFPNVETDLCIYLSLMVTNCTGQ
ncbi:hypothetical protein PR048_018921 [Dryococelus australis]|uniref:Uncharacterized protein n=1 Tax=Dryococelus australis TaxID=614101 RepID=A0ABQ9H240_9NEOP|nr:hypothetical protein PR048_018921 [Dryococelus australis]